MSWINLCTQRHRLRSNLDRDDFEEGEIFDDPQAAVPILLNCAILGDLDRLERNANAIIDSFRDWEAQLSGKRRTPTSLLVLREFLSLSVLLSLVGHADRGILRWASGWPIKRDIEEQAMARVVAAMSKSSESASALEVQIGHTEERIDWAKWANVAPWNNLLDLATCPDHEFWNVLLYWLTPIAAASSKQTGAPILDLLRWGRFHADADCILFERTIPPTETGPRGFDAIVKTATGPAGCYNLSMVDAYHTPEELVKILQYAEEDWNAAGLVGQHLRIYHDPSVDRVRPNDVEQSASVSGTQVTLHSFLEAP